MRRFPLTEAISPSIRRVENDDILPRPVELDQLPGGSGRLSELRTPGAHPRDRFDAGASTVRGWSYLRASCASFKEKSASNGESLGARPAKGRVRSLTLPPGERPLRQIGTLPRSLDPQVFGDYLLSQGMKARIDDRPEGWQVWIYNEDHFARAKTELEDFVSHPDDPRFEQAGMQADSVRQRGGEARSGVSQELPRGRRPVVGSPPPQAALDHGAGDRLGDRLPAAETPGRSECARTRS